MSDAAWHDRWQDNRIGFHADAVNAHLIAYWPTLDIDAQTPVFVPLAGKSLDMLWLRDQGHPVVGIELSPIAVRDFFAEADLEPSIEQVGELQRWHANGITLWCGDYFALCAQNIEGAAAVYDRAALIALPPDLRDRYMHHLAQLLPGGSAGLLITLDYPQSEMKGPPFSVPQDEVRALCASRFACNSLASIDVLQHEPRFRERGVTRMQEKVLRLSRL
ncbi:MAG: thiopurine S-methyltransferase [Pseudomonadota bacterium]